METENFDLIVIGAGVAGYEGAIRASQLGMKVACVEKAKTLGGTCLNVGCIPSKALLESSEQYHNAKHKFAKHGIILGDVKMDVAQMVKRKNDIVRQLTNGIQFLFKKNKIEWIQGAGQFEAIQGENKIIAVRSEDGKVRTLSAKKVLIATGSVPSALPFLPFDGKNVVSSTEALDFTEVPQHLVVVGGGVIGVEMGSVWARLGAKVTIVEFLDRILPGSDQQAVKELQKSLVKLGIEFKLSSKCLGAKSSGGKILLEAEDMTTHSKFTLECDKVLVSTGRRAYTDGLGLDRIGVTPDKSWKIPVDSHYQTTATGVYAAGDIIAGPMLAHKAGEEGVAIAELLAGQAGHVNYSTIPSVVYTWPELSSVGATEEELKAKGVAYKAGSFPFMPNGRAKAMESAEGFVKILADAKTDRVLGVHIVGPWASELIAEATSVMEFGGSAEDIARTCHAHPSLSEVMKEAALAVDKRAIHS